ncbi:MAG TPA: alpha-hydroxy acid oxidase [Bryobacteraceae bacterium]|nr:alpha-hydroxy acid oxidase [Bryobacteraceae bacterium]
MSALARRRLLSWLAASPLALRSQEEPVLTAPGEAINVLDFEAVARKVLPSAHFGYLATGVEDDATLRANRTAFSRYYLRPRRLIDITSVDTHVEIFGQRWPSPIGLAPVGNMMAFHPQAEAAAAHAAKATGTLQVLSTVTNTPLATVNKILGRPAWFQLYPSSRWSVTEELVRRAAQAGTEVLVLTVDTQAGRRTETFDRMRRLDKRDCTSCHGTVRADFYRRKSMFQGIDTTELMTVNPAMTWKHIEVLRNLSTMKLLVKGIETAEDARLCADVGVDGLIVSNHGGRAGESGRGTIDCLPEVVEAVGSRLPVLIDGGFRRGGDVFKALALGAKAILIGRPYVWALAGFGQQGVERAIMLMRAELELTMKQCGVSVLPQIGSRCIGRT